MNHLKQQHLKFTNLPPIAQLIRETIVYITLPETESSGWGETNVQKNIVTISALLASHPFNP